MTHEEMLAALEASDQQSAGPSHEDMIHALETSDQGPSVKDRLKQAAYYATRPLDYAGGLVRTGAATMGQAEANMLGKIKSLATGEDFKPMDAVKPEDMASALKGNAPSISTYLERGGVPELGKLSDVAPALFSKNPSAWRPTPGGDYDPTGRGAIGMAADMALDPLTYLGAGPGKALLAKAGKMGAVAEKVLNPAEKALQSGGKAVYKSAPIMKAADTINERFGKKAASDILFENGISGTGRQVATKAEKLAESFGSERDALLGQAGEAGGVMDMNKAMGPAQEYVDQIRYSGDPQLQPIADSLQGRIKKYLELNPAPEKTIPGETITREVPIGTMPDSWDLATKTVSETKPDQIIPAVRGRTPAEGSAFKTSVYNDTGNATWDTLKRTPQGGKANRVLAQGLDAETSAAAERGVAGAGAKVDDLNNTWGALLTPRQILESEAVKGEKKNVLTAVDAMLAGLTHADPTIMAVKKGADAYKTNWLRTHGGRLMHGTGDIPLLDEALRRQMINQSSQSQIPWDQIRKGK